MSGLVSIPYISDEKAHKSLIAELKRLKVTKNEASDLLTMLRENRINGSACSHCILGSLGKLRGLLYSDISEGPDSLDYYKDFEYWLMNGGPGGGIPTNKDKVATLHRWLSEWNPNSSDINT